MKKLFQIIVVLLLLVIVFFQYKKYRRFNPPRDYDYTMAKGLDTHYYDTQVLQHYYENVYGIGTFARAQWYNHGLDVKFPGEDEEAKRAAAHYNRLIAVTKVLEAKLRYSFQLKRKGYDNKAIRYMIEEGIGPEAYALKDYEYLIGTQVGDTGQKVYIIQTLLEGMGYSTPVDGKFMSDTEEQLKAFQKDRKLIGSGGVDAPTLKALLKDKIK